MCTCRITFLDSMVGYVVLLVSSSWYRYSLTYDSYDIPARHTRLSQVQYAVQVQVLHYYICSARVQVLSCVCVLHGHAMAMPPVVADDDDDDQSPNVVT
jgi:hypothetical protein